MYVSHEAIILFLSLITPSIASPHPLSSSSSSPRITTNGRCGPFAGGTTCKDSKFGPSCAWFGFCGPRESIFFSGWGCQSRYGDCGYEPPKGVQISTDGRCGAVGDREFTCLGAKFGPCCSREGKCGGWEVCAKGGVWGFPSQSPSSTTSSRATGSSAAKTTVLSSTKSSSTPARSTTTTCGRTTSASLVSTSQFTSSKSGAIVNSQTSSGSTSSNVESVSRSQPTSQYTSAKSQAPISRDSSSTSTSSTQSTVSTSAYSQAKSVKSNTQTTTDSIGSSPSSSSTSAGFSPGSNSGFATSLSSTSISTSSALQGLGTSTATPAATSTPGVGTGSASTIEATVVTASSDSPLSTITSQAAGYPVPTSGAAQPTNTYTGGIQAFSSGTPVSVTNPSFENVASRKVKKRQSSAQQAAAAQGWTIQSCGSGTTSDCTFENYDAADGVWAFAGKNGGLVYQDNVNLLMGATYQFTFYYKVVSTYPGATSSSTGNWVVHSISLGDTTNTATANLAPVGSALVESGHDWAMQTLTVTNMQCQYAHFGKPQSDGSVAFRMFINAQASQNGGSQGSLGSFIWYLDQVRVQRMSDPPANYLQSSCGITPPSTATSASPTSTYTVTQTYQPTASVSILAQNAVANPNFESTAFTDYQKDANGGVLKAASWTASGCAQKQCALNNGNGNPPACQSGTYCELWVAPAAWSQTIVLAVGTTYWLSMWAMLTNAPATAGSSVLSMTVEPVGATPGSGGVLLQAVMGASQGWTQYSGLVRINRDFAVNFCGGAATDTSVRCQITIGGLYTGSWTAASGAKNYFDTVSVNATQTWTSSDR